MGVSTSQLVPTVFGGMALTRTKSLAVVASLSESHPAPDAPTFDPETRAHLYWLRLAIVRLQSDFAAVVE